jgi:hypothetical protein
MTSTNAERFFRENATVPEQSVFADAKTADELHLDETREKDVPWKQWGPVREDYSENGDAWNYFTHDRPARRLGSRLSHARPVDCRRRCLHLGVSRTSLMGLVNQNRLRRILTRMLDETEFSQPLRNSIAFAVSRRASLCLFRKRSGIRGKLPTGRIGQRYVRRQFQLARADLDAGQCPDHPRAAPLLRVLRRQLRNRVSDGLGQLF